MIDIKVVGHKVPDTDSVLGAVLFADFLNKKGIYNAKPYIQGKLNKETEFLLDMFNLETPEVATSFPEGTKVALIDHNEKSQTLDNIENLIVEFVIDHHKIDLKTDTPVNIRMEKLCSTCSVIYKMYKEEGLEIDEKIGKLILAGILSDSLLFKSATTTKEDVIIADKLKGITKIESLEDFALPMFNAKSDLGDISIENLIKYDYKEFEFGGKKAGIGTLETTNPAYALGRKEEILKEFIEIKKRDSLDFIILSVVDILGETNTTIVLDGEDSEIISNVFKAEIKKNLADLKNRLSRKKQIVPELMAYFK